MKKALNSKLAGPKKLVRRVLSRTSNSSKTSNEELPVNKEPPMTEDSIFSQEIEALKDQILNLKAAVRSLQSDTDKKEIALAKLAREKEQITLDLLKQKRSNNSLVQQLEDERKYYFKEKEIYCQEMNEYKRMKRSMTNFSSGGDKNKTVAEYQAEIFKLKQTLNQTLEANYNLSIKFLRMKNTKSTLKTELKQLKEDHEKLIKDLKMKIENMANEMSSLVAEKSSLQISPSSRKYLQLVKQNSCLVYENLCLQLEVDKLNLKYKKFKLGETRSETNTRMKCPKHSGHRIEHKESARKPRKNDRPVRGNDVKSEKLANTICPPLQKSASKEQKVVKIFERSGLPGTPKIKILNERETKLKEKNVTKVKKKLESAEKISVNEVTKPEGVSKDESRLALFQVSDLQSQVSTEFTDCTSLVPSVTRVRSAPDIFQSYVIKNVRNENKIK